MNMLGKKRMSEDKIEEDLEICIEYEIVNCNSDDECVKNNDVVNNSIKRTADLNKKMTNEDLLKNSMPEKMWIKEDPKQIRKTMENKIHEKISANKIYSSEMSSSTDHKDIIHNYPFTKKDSNKKEEKMVNFIQTQNKLQNVFQREAQPKLHDQKLNLNTRNIEALGFKKKTPNFDNQQKFPSTVLPLNNKQKLNVCINENKIEKKYLLKKNYSLVLNINTPVTQDEFLEKLISFLKRDDKVHGIFEGGNVYSIFRVDHLNKLGWGLCLRECELIEKIKSNFSIFFREEKLIILHKNENHSIPQNKIISRETQDLLSNEIKKESSKDIDNQNNDKSISDLKLKLHELDVIKNRTFFVKSGAISSKMFL